jgi:hypothetical protein
MSSRRGKHRARVTRNKRTISTLTGVKLGTEQSANIYNFHATKTTQFFDRDSVDEMRAFLGKSRLHLGRVNGSAKFNMTPFFHSFAEKASTEIKKGNTRSTART